MIMCCRFAEGSKKHPVRTKREAEEGAIKPEYQEKGGSKAEKVSGNTFIKGFTLEMEACLVNPEVTPIYQ